LGCPLRARRRFDLPTTQGKSSPAPFVRRPGGGGSLFRIGIAGATALLSFGQDGAPSLHALAPNRASGAAPWPERRSVRADGRMVLLATSPAAGGDVGLVDLDSAAPVQWLTLDLPPLEVESDSLRLSPVGAWFVADGAVYRADLQ